MLFFPRKQKSYSKNRGQKTRTRAKSLEGIQSEGGRVSGGLPQEEEVSNTQ